VERAVVEMNVEPPYTRPAWPVLTKEGSGGVRGALRHLMAEPSTRLAFCWFFYNSNIILQIKKLTRILLLASFYKIYRFADK
jgi:hypothetical protein